MIKWRGARPPRKPFTPPADLQLGNLDRADGLRTAAEVDVIASAEAAIAAASLEHHVKHLTVSAMWHLNRGKGPRTVLAFLHDPETRRIYGPDAVAVVATLVGGGSR